MAKQEDNFLNMEADCKYLKFEVHRQKSKLQIRNTLYSLARKMGFCPYFLKYLAQYPCFETI